MDLFQQQPFLKVIKELAKTNRTSIFLVGGFLRDLYLKRETADYDFCVEKDALKFAEAFAQQIHGVFIVLDEDRKCGRVIKKKNQKVTTFDFTDFRAKTLKGDLAARDFTINTFYIDLLKWQDGMDLFQLLKKQKRAFADLRKKTICMTGKKIFLEDPLRMLRAFSLKASLGFTIDASTIDEIKKNVDLIRTVSAERINTELFKIFAGAQTAKVLKQMDRCGILERVIPQVRVMYKCEQGGYHHLDVWKHSLEAVAQADYLFKEIKEESHLNEYLDEKIGGNHSRRSIIKFAALLHDIGKPQTRKRNEIRYTFYGHERVGKGIVRTICKLLKVSTKERYVIEDLVLHHLRPGFLSNFKKPSERSIFRFFRDTKEEAVSVLLLSLADQRATRGPMTTQEDQLHHETICKNLIVRYFDKTKEVPKERLITGHDIRKILKVKPSPLYGKILTDVEEKQGLGKIQTRKQALEYVRKYKK